MAFARPVERLKARLIVEPPDRNLPTNRHTRTACCIRCALNELIITKVCVWTVAAFAYARKEIIDHAIFVVIDAIALGIRITGLRRAIGPDALIAGLYAGTARC